MDGIGQYVMAVLSAAIISAIVIRILGKNNATGNIIKMICAVFMTVTVISPLIKFRFNDISHFINTADNDAEGIISEAQSQAENELLTIIKEKTQTYIMNKAAVHGSAISVSVDITEPDSLTPDIITIEGEVSPYVKEVLKKIISEELGIPEEKQIWK